MTTLSLSLSLSLLRDLLFRNLLGELLLLELEAARPVWWATFRAAGSSSLLESLSHWFINGILSHWFIIRPVLDG